MVKSYLKFEHSKTFGQVCSATSNALWIPDETAPGTPKTSDSGRAVVAASEDVLVWEIKTGELLSRWTVTDNHAQVTTIARSQTDPDVFAVGYEDGRIRLWDLRTATVVLAFNGHKSAITCFSFDESGVKLASGARDTDIIVWDLVTEVGKFRLRGHKDQITSLSFLRPLNFHHDEVNVRSLSNADLVAGSENETNGFLLSTSKDALIKVWDLSSQHCMETHVAQSNGECWTLGLSPDHSGCITAGNDGELRAWTIDGDALSAADSSKRVLKDRGSFYRNGKDRTIGVSFHPRKDFIALHGSEKSIELWRIRSEAEIRKNLARKRKRKREKMEEMDGDTEMAEAEGKSADTSTALITEVFVPYLIVRTGSRVRSIDWAGGKSGKAISILAATANNQIELYTAADADPKKKLKSSEQPDYTRTLSVDMPGHRTDIRCVTISSDDRMLATASHGSLKIWNVRTTSCIRTLDCGYALSIAFLPGDRAVIIGTKEGTLQLFDIASSTILDTISAHEKDVWSLHVHPDGKSLVTGSADKSAKFWDFRVVQEEILGTTRKQPKLTLVHTRTLRLSDDVLCLGFSPDARLLAVSDLSNTVKVFFTDTLKPYLTLYGHKLPVLSLSISYDNKLIVTSSADKNIRIWGLDHGDCHRALFAHQDSILSVAFMPNNNEGNGHHFFSASKDRAIKYFDADKFEQIQKLEGHHGEIWALAVANSGEFLVSASHDKSIRVWQQGDEQVFLEEEREKEMEELYEGTLVKGLEADDQDGEDAEGKIIEAGKQTVETLMAGEKIQEALEVGMEDLEVMRQHEEAQAANPKAKMAPAQRNLIFTAAGDASASGYVLGVFQKIPAASLQDALLVLSFSQLPALFTFLALWASEGRNMTLVCRVLFFMLKVHQKQLVSSRLMRVELENVRESLRATLKKQKDELGYNLAGLRILGRRVRELGESGYVDGEVDQDAADVMSKSGRKRAFVNIA